jgi:hypothetical protein
VTPAADIAKSVPTTETGLFATLAGLLHVKGSGASKIGQASDVPKAGRRLVLSALLATLGVLAFASAPALAAAAPEEPTTLSPAKSITATSAIFEGVLNPHSKALAGGYFAYSEPDGLTCAEGPTVALEGFEGEQDVKAQAVHAAVSLQPDRKYKFCLVATNEEGEQATPGKEVTVETPAAPPAIEGESASNVASSEVTFGGAVNPNNQFTECHFQYGSGPVTESTIPCTPEILKGFGYQGVGPSKLVVEEDGEEEPVPVPTGVSEGTLYHYQIVAKNGDGEEARGPVQSFQTFEAPIAEAPTEVSKTAWELHGVLDPKNARSEEPGSYEFVYRQSSSECRYVLSPEELKNLRAEIKVAKSHGDKARQTEEEAELASDEAKQGEDKHTAREEASGAEGQEANPVEVMGLLPGAPYTVCLLVRNGAENPAAISSQETFTTVPAPPMIAGESASAVEANAATLEAEIVPEGAATTTHFEYLTQAQYEADGNTFGEGAVTTPESASVGSEDTVEHVTPVRIPAEPDKPALTPSTIYRYRVVATNSQSPAGGTSGPGKTFTTSPAATASAPPQNCANEQRRAEQPFGLTLPDCRAYELVSPADTEGQNATEEEYADRARAAEAGAPGRPSDAPLSEGEEKGAVTYQTSGAFAGTSTEPTGATTENQYLSRRNSARGRWETQAITPLHEPDKTETGGSYEQGLFTSDLTEGIASSNAALTEEAHKTEAVGGVRELNLYRADFESGAYRYITTELNNPLGASTDLSHVVFGHVLFGQAGPISEWVNGATVPVGVTNNKDENMNNDSVAGWHGVSADGSRVYLATEGQLYARVNAEQKQSRTVHPEASGNGTLVKGSNEVSSLTLVAGYLVAELGAATTEYPVAVKSGRFVVGQLVSGAGIEPETTITAIEPGTDPVEGHGKPYEILTLSEPTADERIESSFTTEGVPATQISSRGPEPFEVGQKITGNGIQPDTTITEAKLGKLTLSQPAASSGSEEALYGGGECTEAELACTVLVSAPRRLQANSAGTQEAKYWGASTDGSKVFFTSKAELTEGAYTGLDGQGEDLYEYDLETKTLTDLTAVTEAEQAEDPNGAVVQGVAQISEDGSYVYFVAKGVLTGGEENQRHEKAKTEADNLYLSVGGHVTFIATLGSEDSADWNSSPETNTAVVSAGGSYLAFLSKESLTGYDNEHAKSGECENKAGFFNQNEGTTGRCQEAYLYDAGSGGAGSLTCASCNPTGARPVGPTNLGQPRGVEGLYRPRVLTADGTLFFDSYDALVPHSNDSRQNVYEYEDGEIHPISNVSGGYESFLLDASASGGDVYFATSDRLLQQDPGGSVVVYDARIDGGFSVAPIAPSCDSGDSCKPPESAQPSVFAPTGSATFSGLGNFSPAVSLPPPKKTTKKTVKCKKGLVKNKQGKCVKRSKKKAKRASRGRRDK